jgi:ABC-type transport system substrate-binding protein
MDYPSPQNFLEPLYSTQSQPPAGSNTSFYSNPQFDSLVAQGNAATSGKEAIGFYNRAEDVLLEDMPIIPLFFDVTQSVHSAHVRKMAVDVFGRVDTSSLGQS